VRSVVDAVLASPQNGGDVAAASPTGAGGPS
jgi:hypothetical protein